MEARQAIIEGTLDAGGSWVRKKHTHKEVLVKSIDHLQIYTNEYGQRQANEFVVVML